MSHNFTDNGTFEFHQKVESPALVVSGTWGGGTMTVKLNGVSLLTTYTDTIEHTFDTGRKAVKVELVLSGATSPDLNAYII